MALDVSYTPRPATAPPNGVRRFTVAVEGVKESDLTRVWSQLWSNSAPPSSPAFKAIYPNLTTVQGNRFRFRGGDPEQTRESLRQLLEERLNAPVRTTLVG
jgi:hypothetical protein